MSSWATDDAPPSAAPLAVGMDPPAKRRRGLDGDVLPAGPANNIPSFSALAADADYERIVRAHARPGACDVVEAFIRARGAARPHLSTLRAAGADLAGLDVELRGLAEQVEDLTGYAAHAQWFDRDVVRADFEGVLAGRARARARAAAARAAAEQARAALAVIAAEFAATTDAHPKLRATAQAALAARVAYADAMVAAAVAATAPLDALIAERRAQFEDYNRPSTPPAE